VLDTNVLVSGIAYPKSIPARIVAAWNRGAIEVVLSQYILDELARVLPRLDHKLRWQPSDYANLIDILTLRAETVGQASGPKVSATSATFRPRPLLASKRITSSPATRSAHARRRYPAIVARGFLAGMAFLRARRSARLKPPAVSCIFHMTPSGDPHDDQSRRQAARRQAFRTNSTPPRSAVAKVNVAEAAKGKIAIFSLPGVYADLLGEAHPTICRRATS
jgi:hypothetical protein